MARQNNIGDGLPIVAEFRSRVLNTATANLLEYYPLWEREGTTAYDASGNGRNGTYTAPRFQQAGIDGLSCPYFRSLNYQSTVNIWGGVSAVYDKTNGSAVIWARADPALHTWNANQIFRTADPVLVIYGGSSPTAGYNFYCGGKSGSYTLRGRFFDWHVWGLTWSSTVGTAVCKAYFDGVLVWTSSAGYTASGTPSKFWIGSDGGTQNHWQGWLAHFALWNAQLSDAEMQSITRR